MRKKKEKEPDGTLSNGPKKPKYVCREIRNYECVAGNVSTVIEDGWITTIHIATAKQWKASMNVSELDEAILNLVTVLKKTAHD